MKYLFLFVFASISLSLNGNYLTEKWQYDIELVSESNKSSYIVKVYSYFKKPKLDIEIAKKNTVHGIMFRGLQNHPPLIKDASIEKSKMEFFNVFFGESRIYSKFVNEITDGSISMGDIVKVKKGYKIGQHLGVNHLQLRKYLESQGIIKALSNGF